MFDHAVRCYAHNGAKDAVDFTIHQYVIYLVHLVELLLVYVVVRRQLMMERAVEKCNVDEENKEEQGERISKTMMI